MQQQLVRTTVQLDPELYRNVKIRMAEEGMTFRQMIHIGLTLVLDQSHFQKSGKSQKKVKFGGYNMGKMKGSFSRKDIYEDIESDIV